LKGFSTTRGERSGLGRPHICCVKEHNLNYEKRAVRRLRVSPDVLRGLLTMACRVAGRERKDSPATGRARSRQVVNGFSVCRKGGYLFSALSISQLATQRTAHIWISVFFLGTFCEASGTTMSDCGPSAMSNVHSNCKD